MRAFKKTMDYFGLSEPQHEDLETYQDEYLEESSAAPGASLPTNPVAELKPTPAKTVLDNVTDFSESRSALAAVETKKASSKGMARIMTIHPTRFEDAPQIGQSLRDGVPVIVNLSDMNQAEQRRMVDFCAGVVFAINGHIERVSQLVFLLSPASVEVLEETEQRPSSRRSF